MGMEFDILRFLSRSHRGYIYRGKLLREIRNGHSSTRGGSENSARITLYRLRKKGLVEKQGGVWNIASAGLALIRRRDEKRLTRAKEKELIIAFDIPEAKKKLRFWLRGQLLELGFEMIQKSVWHGPAPLPNGFVEDMNEKGVLGYMLFFQAKRVDMVGLR